MLRKLMVVKEVVPLGALAFIRRQISLVMISTSKVHMQSLRKARLNKTGFLCGTIDHY
jgi:hypothetical protein